MINISTILGSLVVLLALAACSQNDVDKTAGAGRVNDAKGPVAVTVNGSPISQREVDMLLRQQPPQHDEPTARQRVLDNITLQVIVSQEAVKKGLDKSPDVMDQFEMARTSILAQSYVKDYFKNHKVSDAELNAAYDKLKADANGKQYRARHILVKTKEDGEAIIARLKKDPDSFSELATAQSLDPVTKPKGGDLGWFDTKRMDPDFAAAIANLQKGKFTEEPVKSQFGYHVIMLDDVRSNVETVPPLEQVKDGLTDQLRQQDLRKMLDTLKANAKVEVSPPAKAS
ncbi:hypothetical protein BCY88_37245 [Paraburkholderia fungorum]|uniref:peptidylprolyl isomerase n=1 Tax=Paraburkholderia fungorum TaxID=134537 RepID=A0A3R7L7P3_9BURK|nr:hypothetical protein BCY88_37245 [Paraburkholderia fungorum]